MTSIQLNDLEINMPIVSNEKKKIILEKIRKKNNETVQELMTEVMQIEWKNHDNIYYKNISKKIKKKIDNNFINN